MTTSQEAPRAREGILDLVRDHLSAELEVDRARIDDGSRFREDLDADSLDLYDLVMELQDTYAIKVSEEEAVEIRTVGDAVDFVVAKLPS